MAIAPCRGRKTTTGPSRNLFICYHGNLRAALGRIQLHERAEVFLGYKMILFGKNESMKYVSMDISLRRIISSCARTAVGSVGTASEGGIKEIYKYFSQQPNTSDIDSSFYRDIAKISFESWIPANSGSILDLGCGKQFQAAEIYKNIAPSAKVYGVDVAVGQRLNMPNNTSIFRADIESYLGGYPASSEVVVFVNSLCFLSDDTVTWTFSRLSNIGCKRVIILEPWPSFFWDPHFGEFSANLRQIDSLCRLIPKIEKQRMERLAFGKKLGFGLLFPLVYGLLVEFE